jgi:DNA (cytosine-5)-methyltransferase 1
LVEFIDLFSGIGGMRIGFEEAGCECVFSSEIDRHAQDTYETNFGERPIGDIRDITSDQIPPHDILIGGFPCQPFSIAGVSKLSSMGREHGLIEETRGTLFYEISRILEHHQPKAFLLENVKGLIWHGNPLHKVEGLGAKRIESLLEEFGSRRNAVNATEGELQRVHGIGEVLSKRIRNSRTFPIINQILESLGYNVTHKVISSANFVPQRRERVFIVGFLQDVKFGFPDPPDQKPVLADILEEDVDPKYTLNDHLWNYHQERKKMQKEKGNGFGYRMFAPNDTSGTLPARYYKDGADILLEQPGGNPRRLTPRECARLMGFPDDFVLNKSEVQAYKQLGNAVVPPLVSMIAKSMVKHL